MERSMPILQFTTNESPLKKFEIRPLTLAYREEATKLVTEVFVTSEPLVAYLGSKPENMKPLIEFLVKRSIEDGLGVMVVDLDTAEIAFVMIIIDNYQSDIPPHILEEKHCEVVLNFLDECYKDELIQQLSQKPFSCINFIAIASPSKYREIGIGEKFLAWTMHEHPLIKQANALVGVTTHPKTRTIVTKAGWKVRKITKISEYTNSNGEKPFNDFEEVMEKKLGLKRHDGAHLVTYLKKQANL